MLVKVVGALAVVISGSLVGRTLALNYDQRPGQLWACQQGLQMLETEISYSATPLPEAWQHLAKTCQFPMRDIVDQAYAIYCRQPGITAGEAWDMALEATFEHNSLTRLDLEVLKGLGKNLGATSGHDQAKHLKLVIHQLQQQEQEARFAAGRNSKQIRYLGMLGGMMLALMII